MQDNIVTFVISLGNGVVQAICEVLQQDGQTLAEEDCKLLYSNSREYIALKYSFPYISLVHPIIGEGMPIFVLSQ